MQAERPAPPPPGGCDSSDQVATTAKDETKPLQTTAEAAKGPHTTTITTLGSMEESSLGRRVSWGLRISPMSTIKFIDGIWDHIWQLILTSPIDADTAAIQLKRNLRGVVELSVCAKILAAKVDTDLRSALTQERFEKWLSIFSRTADEITQEEFKSALLLMRVEESPAAAGRITIAAKSKPFIDQSIDMIHSTFMHSKQVKDDLEEFILPREWASVLLLSQPKPTMMFGISQPREEAELNDGDDQYLLSLVIRTPLAILINPIGGGDPFATNHIRLMAVDEKDQKVKFRNLDGTLTLPTPGDWKVTILNLIHAIEMKMEKKTSSSTTTAPTTSAASTTAATASTSAPTPSSFRYEPRPKKPKPASTNP